MTRADDAAPSSHRRLIVEADGGSRGNPGPAAYGAVVRAADTGEVLAEVAETIGVATNNVAEYRGVLAGLRAAHEIDPNAVVEARLDSKLVVEQMSGRWKIKNADLRPLALEVRRIYPSGHVTYTWVPRADNAHADRLLNQVLDGKPVGAAPEPATVANRLAAWAPELGTPTTLLAVRHGQTPMTAARRFNGSSGEDPGLDAVGQEQAARVAATLSTSGAAAVVASPARRARDTADVIAAALGVAVEIDDRWQECDFGQWEGMTLTEIGERFPGEVSRWFSSTSNPPPRGESFDEVASRAIKARDATVGRYPGQPIVIVTHSIPLRVLAREALGAPAEALFRLQPSPASLTEVTVYADGTTALNVFGQRPVTGRS